MADRLDYQKSAEIVESVLKVRTGAPFSRFSYLGDVLPKIEERELFRREVRVSVKKHGFRINPIDIPIDPHLSINHIAEAVTSSALPGDPTVPDDD